MLRAREFSKLLTCSTTRQYYTRLFSKDFNHRLRNEYTIVIRRYSDKNKDKGPKVSTEKCNESSIQSHPSKTQPDPDPCQNPNVKLKECKPVSIMPCRPSPAGYRAKMSSLKDCPPPNLMSELPDPSCPWDEQDKAYRSKSKTILWIGILFAAVSLGTAWYVGIFDTERKKDKKVLKKDVRKKIKLPQLSKDIPNDVPYLLIGGGTASFTAFRAIKSAHPTAKVLVITNENYFPYMRPPLSKEIWFNDDPEAVEKLIFKQWNGSERSLFYEPDDFYTDCRALMTQENGGVAVVRGWTVTDIDVIEKQVTLDDGYQIHYDKCLIATGSKPKFSPVFQVAIEDARIAERVRGYRNIFDFLDMNEIFEASRNIAVIGGGFLGSELVCAMARKDKKQAKHIYQIFPEKGNMGKILPEYLSLWTSDRVRSEGVQVIPETEIVCVNTDGKALQLTMNNGKVLTVDYALVAVGAEPNTELAKNSGLEIDPELGGYLVNTELQARSDLYIAGDCACFYDIKLGRRRVEHHDHAVVTGRLAGENMTGARKPYLHQSMFWSDLGPDVGYEAIGIVDSTLPTVAVFAKATEKDNPKAVVTATGDAIRSSTEENPIQLKVTNIENTDPSCPNIDAGEDFGKGIIFYLRDDIVVGIVLWNVFNRMSIARQVLKDQKKYEDLNEVAKLFNIHEE